MFTLLNTEPFCYTTQRMISIIQPFMSSDPTSITYFRMSFTVTVKWGKEKFSDVEINTAEPPEVFKAQLFALTKYDTTKWSSESRFNF